MNKYIISAESTTDLSNEKLKELGVPYIGYRYMIDDKEHIDDLGKTLTNKEFYDAMRAGSSTKTSQVTTPLFVKHFEPLLKEGLDIVHMTLSSGLSNTYYQALEAQKEMQEKYPERKIYIINSLGASSGFGLLIDKLVELKNEGKSIEEVVEFIEKYKLSLHHWFYSTDLSYYVKGGRISSASGFIGSILNICPVLDVDKEGKLIPRFKTIGKKRAQTKLLQQMKAFALGGQAYNEKCFISHSDCYEDARKLADDIEKEFPKLKGSVEIYNIGTTIGSHTGPGTVALFFWGEQRKE